MPEAQQLVTGPQAIERGLLLKVHGEVDFSRAPELRNALLQAIQQQPDRLVVDLSDVSYMDSSGLATLVEALGLQNKRHGKLVLLALQPKVRNILEIARLDAVFTIRDSTDQLSDV